MVRGSGKFKVKRGGGRNFSAGLRDIAVADRRYQKEEEDNDDDDDSDYSDDKEGQEEQGEKEEEEEDNKEESEGGADGGTKSIPLVGSSKQSNPEPEPELTRAERRQLKRKNAQQKKQTTGKNGGDEEDDEKAEDVELMNPNRLPVGKMTLSDLNVPRELSRKDREKQEAKERYFQLGLQGKTPEAKADLARLKLIRAKRDAEKAKREAEAAAKAQEAERQRNAQASR